MKDLEPGDETDARVPRRRPPARAPRPGQDGVPRPRRPLRPDPAAGARDVLGDEAFERLLTIDLGDLIGADGTIFKTRRGELSVATRRLARCWRSRCVRRLRSTTG